jgi:hypothetical protein
LAQVFARGRVWDVMTPRPPRAELHDVPITLGWTHLSPADDHPPHAAAGRRTQRILGVVAALVVLAGGAGAVLVSDADARVPDCERVIGQR